jgi:hypothetical protein
MKRIEVYLGRNLRNDPVNQSVLITLYNRKREIGIEDGDFFLGGDGRTEADLISSPFDDHRAHELSESINRVQYFCAKLVDYTPPPTTASSDTK